MLFRSTGDALFSFECSETFGALVMLSPSGISTDLLSPAHIKKYMRAHFSSWMEFANGKFGLELQEDELLFVSGVVKTCRWAVAAFHGDYCTKQGAIAANLTSLAALNFSVTISDARLDSPYYRVGPPTQPSTGQLDEASDKFDQTIFLHYYKMKRRLFTKRPMKGAAGPHHLPRPPPVSDDRDNVRLSPQTPSPDVVDIESVPKRQQVSRIAVRVVL